MSFKRSKWKPGEHNWASFDETKFYRKFLNRKENKFFHKQREEPEVKTLVHSDLNERQTKIEKKINYFTNRILGKYINKSRIAQDWKVEVWIKEEASSPTDKTTCAVALTRPRKGQFFVKKVGKNINESLRACLNTIVRQIKKNKPRTHMPAIEHAQA